MKHGIVFLLIIVMFNLGETRPKKVKPGKCPSTGMASICVCRNLPSECRTDNECRGTLKCCALSCDCTRSCVPPGDCYYNGKSYLIGQSYPSKDGCNKCTCTSDYTSSCTERACGGYQGK